MAVPPPSYDGGVPFSYVAHVAPGGVDEFAIPFPYVDREDIHVYIGDVEDVSYTFLNDSLIQTSSVPALDTVVTIRRETPIQTPDHVFDGAGTLTPDQLDANSIQFLYATQEAIDAALGEIALTVDTVALAAQVSTDAAQVSTDAAQVALDRTAVETVTTDIVDSWDFSASVPFSLLEDDTAWRVVMTRALQIPVGATGSQASIPLAPSGGAFTLSLRKNGAAFGTLSFADASTTPVFTVAAPVTFAAGDIFDAICGVPNGAVEQVSVSIVFSRV